MTTLSSRQSGSLHTASSGEWGTPVGSQQAGVPAQSPSIRSVARSSSPPFLPPAPLPPGFSIRPSSESPQSVRRLRPSLRSLSRLSHLSPSPAASDPETGVVSLARITTVRLVSPEGRGAHSSSPLGSHPIVPADYASSTPGSFELESSGPETPTPSVTASSTRPWAGSQSSLPSERPHTVVGFPLSSPVDSLGGGSLTPVAPTKKPSVGRFGSVSVFSPFPPSTFQTKMARRSPPRTPGVDDSPFIRYALDQLTRDNIPFVRSQPGVAVDNYPYQMDDYHPAFTQFDVDPNAPALPAPSLKPHHRTISSDGGLGVHHPSTGNGQSRLSGAHLPASAAQPPASAISAASTGTAPVPVTPSDLSGFLSVAQQDNSRPADFLPRPLRLSGLAGLVVYVIVMLILLVVAGTASVSTGVISRYIVRDALPGVAIYDHFGDALYFAFRFLPTMLVLVNVVCLSHIDSAVTRIAPFIGLAGFSQVARLHALYLPAAATQFAFPNRAINLIRSRQSTLGFCLLIFWLQIFSVPIAATVFNVRLFRLESDQDSVWRWTAVQGPVWTLFCLLLLELVALSVLAFHLNRRSASSGLRADPRSIADYVTILSRSNCLDRFDGSEILATEAHIRGKLAGGDPILGYWASSNQPELSFYGLAELGGRPERTSEVPKSPINPTAPSQRRFLPAMLRPVVLIPVAACAVALFCVFAGLSYWNSNLKRGFAPSVIVRANTTNFSAANFVYSFVPAMLAMMLLLALQTIDLRLRQITPLTTLASSVALDGATADQTVLADYVHQPVYTAVISAARNRDWAVAAVSFAALCSLTLPVLASGFLWAQYFAPSTLVSALMPALHALTFFLAVAVTGICVAATHVVVLRRRHMLGLPHQADSLAELFSWLYMSPLLDDHSVDHPRHRDHLISRFRGPQPNQGRNLLLPHYRYAFGLYRGRDGADHVGIDVVARHANGDPVLFPRGIAGQSPADAGSFIWRVGSEEPAREKVERLV